MARMARFYEKSSAMRQIWALILPRRKIVLINSGDKYFKETDNKLTLLLGSDVYKNK
jgi:hypothetical protein